jgi:hypothetical protein
MFGFPFPAAPLPPRPLPEAFLSSEEVSVQPLSLLLLDFEGSPLPSRAALPLALLLAAVIGGASLCDSLSLELDEDELAGLTVTSVTVLRRGAAEAACDTAALELACAAAELEVATAATA